MQYLNSYKNHDLIVNLNNLMAVSLFVTYNRDFEFTRHCTILNRERSCDASLLVLLLLSKASSDLLFKITLKLVIPENKRNKFSSYIMMFEATIGVLTVGSVYLWRNTFYTILMMISIAVIQQCFVYYSPESPKFLYSSNKIREMEKSFKMIAHYNGYNLKENDLDISEPSSASTNNASQTLLQSFSDNIYKRNLIIMCFVYCVSYMNYYVIGFYVSKFNGNLFINALLLLSADLSSNLSCSYIYEKLGLKRSFMLVFIIITSATIIYSLFSNYPEITYACVFVMRFGAILATTLSMYSCSVLFETNIRARSFAFCNFTGRFLTIYAPMIVTLISNPMAILTTLAICASIISQFLHSSK